MSDKMNLTEIQEKIEKESSANTIASDKNISKTLLKPLGSSDEEPGGENSELSGDDDNIPFIKTDDEDDEFGDLDFKEEEIKGIIVETPNDTEKKPDGIVVGGLGEERMDGVQNQLREMDLHIEHLKALKEQREHEEEDEIDEDIKAEEEVEKIIADFEEAKVIIDKTGIGGIINFTPEEREKLEYAKKIKVEEIEEVNLKTLKVKKPKKNVDKILKSKNNHLSTPIVLISSGYTAVMRGASVYEITELAIDTNDPMQDAITKWTMLYDKIESTSLGKMTFNEFLRNTAASDYNMLVYGVLAATYPNADKFPLNCKKDKCKTEFLHEYDIRSLIRVEQFTEKQKEMFMRIADASHIEEEAIAVHNESPVMNKKAIKLPMSGYIINLHVTSAYDLIYNSFKALNTAKEKDKKFNTAAVIATAVHSFLIEDEDGAYDEFTNSMDICKIIYSLDSVDMKILDAQSEEINKDTNVSFGFIDVRCPQCGTVTPILEIDVESVLFYNQHREMTTNVESNK